MDCVTQLAETISRETHTIFFSSTRLYSSSPVPFKPTSSLKFKKLKKGKTYYIKIRPYTEVNNAATDNTTTVNGVWSAKKTIRIRK